jgi:hypothetical protein
MRREIELDKKVNTEDRTTRWQEVQYIPNTIPFHSEPTVQPTNRHSGVGHTRLEIKQGRCTYHRWNRYKKWKSRQARRLRDQDRGK